MNIGLIDVDGHNFPNLALMKISAYHKAHGDSVEWWSANGYYDIVYMSKVFDNTYSPDIEPPKNCERVIKGGTGYNLQNQLPYEIEHIYPDYTLYPEYTKNTAFGFLTRGCPRACHFCIVSAKEGAKSYKVADLSEWWNGQKYIELMDANILACDQRFDLLKQLCDSGAIVNFNQGLDVRLLTPEIISIINDIKIREIHFAWDYMKYSNSIIRGLKLYAECAKRRPHGTFASVYCLTNYDTNMDENLYRVYTLREMGYDPYIMIYDKPNAPRIIKRLQRWVNNKILFKSISRFEDFLSTYKRG